MPRASDGTYSLPTGNPVISGEVITSTWANTTMPDIAQALTDSLDRYGRGGMLAPFEFSDGNEGAPGATWANEPSTGFYRAGAGDLRATVLGQDLTRWSNGVFQVWNGTGWETVVSGAASVPDGSVAWQTLSWDNTAGGWVANTDLTVNQDSGAVSAALFVEDGTQLSSKYLAINGTALNSQNLDSLDSLYFLDSSNQSAGILPRARLGVSTQTYDINITGSAGTTSGTAEDSLLLEGEDKAFYLNSSNQNAGTLNRARLTGIYDIDITGNAATATNASQADSAVNATTWGTPGYSIEVGGTGAGADSNTIYFRTS